MSWEVRFYTSQDAHLWDSQVERCKNATFMHRRGYMDYHADRFTDASLMIFYRGKLFALLPANREGSTLVSHRGLSYGGLLLDGQATVARVGECWHSIISFLLQQGYKQLIYKALPFFYHRLPAFEDVFWLRWHWQAVQMQTDMGAVVDLTAPLQFSTGKKRHIAKAKRHQLQIRSDVADILVFWEQILTPNLQKRHGVLPVHQLAEIQLLMSRFPDNIRFYGVYQGCELVGGTVLFLADNAVHAQYIAANATGKELSALDLLFSELLQHFKTIYRYFSFGISTYDKGQALNEGLARWKEEFGARTWLHETLLLQLSKS